MPAHGVVACADVTALCGCPPAYRFEPALLFQTPTSTLAIIHGPCWYTFEHAVDRAATKAFWVAEFRYFSRRRTLRLPPSGRGTMCKVSRHRWAWIFRHTLALPQAKEPSYLSAECREVATFIRIGLERHGRRLLLRSRHPWLS